MTGLALALVSGYVMAGASLIIHCVALVIQGRRERRK